MSGLGYLESNTGRQNNATEQQRGGGGGRLVTFRSGKMELYLNSEKIQSKMKHQANIVNDASQKQTECREENRKVGRE